MDKHFHLVGNMLVESAFKGNDRLIIPRDDGKVRMLQSSHGDRDCLLLLVKVYVSHFTFMGQAGDWYE